MTTLLMAPTKAPADSFRPALVAELETSTGELQVHSGDPVRDERALLLVRTAGRPVDLLRLDLPDRDPDDPGRGWVALATAAMQATQQATAGDSGRQTPQVDTDTLEVAVVICTLGTHPKLPESVRSVLAQTHERLRLVVVDNAPASGATRAALAGIDDPRLSIVDEPLPGLSRARNRGLAAVTEPLVAFTDDDAIADPGWIAGLLRVLAHDPDAEVQVVTGLVLPAELRSEAQEWFEEYGGFSKGFAPLWWAADPDRRARPGLGEPGPRGPLFPVTTGKVGSGNSMLFRREAILAVGGFDPALGAGTVALGGEDLDSFAALLLAGGLAAYTPDSIVWHHHRPTYEGLRTQIRGCGVGMGAVILKHTLRRPRLLAQVAAAVLPLARAGLSPSSERNAGHGTAYPRQLVLDEVRGLAEAPLRYARSVLRARRPAAPPERTT